MFPLPLGRETLHELIGAKVSSGGRANEGFRKEKWVTADQREISSFCTHAFFAAQT